MADQLSQFDVPKTQTPFDFAGMQKQNQDFTQGLANFIPQNQAQTESSFGLPLMRENFLRGNEALNSLQSRIMNVPQNIADTTRESFLNEGQRAKMQTAQEAPLQKQYGVLSQGQTNLGNSLNMYEGLAQSRQQAALLPWEMGHSDIERYQAAQMAGWTATNKNELDRLIANQQAGLTLTNQQAQRAHELAMQEQTYKNTLAINKAQQNPFVSLAPSNSLFNTQTGKSMYQAPAAPKVANTVPLWPSSVGENGASTNSNDGFIPNGETW